MVTETEKDYNVCETFNYTNFSIVLCQTLVLDIYSNSFYYEQFFKAVKLKEKQ